MKKLILVLPMLLMALICPAQTNVYHPFPTDSAVWYRYDQNWQGTYSNYWYQWLGKVEINGLTYVKTFYKGNGTGGQFVHTGYVRQDIPNEKIYSLDLQGVETDITVNPHLSAGDTCYNCLGDTSIVESIDSLLVGTKYHKQYRLVLADSSGSFLYAEYVIGLGLRSIYEFEWATGLWCFSVNSSNNLINTGAPGCPLDFTVGVNESLLQEPRMSISPNPARSLVNIDSPFYQTSFRIINGMGQTVLTHDPGTHKSSIDISSLSPGIYFVIDALNHLPAQRFIKE